MKLPRREFLHLAMGAVALPVAPARCQGANVSRPKTVRLVVGYAAGGADGIPRASTGQMAVGSGEANRL